MMPSIQKQKHGQDNRLYYAKKIVSRYESQLSDKNVNHAKFCKSNTQETLNTCRTPRKIGYFFFSYNNDALAMIEELQ